MISTSWERCGVRQLVAYLDSGDYFTTPYNSAVFTSKKADRGGAFVGEVLMEWTTDPEKPAPWEVRSVRLPKNPSKARLLSCQCACAGSCSSGHVYGCVSR